MTKEDDDDFPFPNLFDDPKAVEIDEWFNTQLKREDKDYVEKVLSIPWFDDKADKKSRLGQIILALEVVAAQDAGTIFTKSMLDKIYTITSELYSVAEEV